MKDRLDRQEFTEHIVAATLAILLIGYALGLFITVVGGVIIAAWKIGGWVLGE